jgi:hypothetical protein
MVEAKQEIYKVNLISGNDEVSKPFYNKAIPKYLQIWEEGLLSL